MSERSTGRRAEPVNPMASEGKALAIDLLQRNRQKFFTLTGDPHNWHVPTRISGWEVRDLYRGITRISPGTIEILPGIWVRYRASERCT